MTHRLIAQRAVLVLVALSCLTWTEARLSAADDAAAGPDENQAGAAVSSTPAPPDATEYDLRYKLATGDVLRYEVTHRASIRSTIDGTTQAAQTKTDSVKVWKVSDVLPSGDTEFISVVERVHMINQLPDRDPTEYDSEKDKTAPPGFEDVARAVGVPLSIIRMTPRGKVVRRDVKTPQQSVEEDTPIVVRLPEEPVVIGATWDNPFELQVTVQTGETKSIQTRRHYKLADVSHGIATIEVTYQVLSPIDAHIESQLVQRLMDGEVRFDIESGRVVGQHMEVDKRILGFAGPASSLHYIMRMEEKLLEPEAKVATKTTTKTATKTTSSKSTNQRRPTRNTRTATRTRMPQSTKGYRR